MADNRRSRIITAGVARSPNRAMLRAVGFKDGDFDKPIVGVANGHSTMNPCNAGIQPLVDRAMVALSAGGAKPQVFRFPHRDRRHRHGHRGDEVFAGIARSDRRRHRGRGNGPVHGRGLCVGGCDKNMPGAMMAMARMNVPGDLRLRRHHQARHLEGTEADHRQSLRSGRRVHRRQDVGGGPRSASRRTRARRVGACGGQYTANTMSSSFEALGLSLLGSSQLASPDPEKADSAAASAQGAYQRRRPRPQAARHHHAQVDRERDRAGDGDRRLDQRGAALSGDRVGCRRASGHRRLRSASASECRCCATSSLRDAMSRSISIPPAACRRC